MRYKIVQININHSWGAHDLLMQYVAENKIAIGLISEPIHIPDSPAWFSSLDKKAAIFINHNYFKESFCLFHKGNGYVAVKCGNCVIASVYISPNIDTGRFLTATNELSDLVVKAERILIIGGDLNAKSTMWASKSTNTRGKLIEEWSAECDLRLMNVGEAPTCTRAKGTSIVDLTWCTADLAGSVIDWKVEERETLSDHMYITFMVEDGRYLPAGAQTPAKHPWSFGKMDVDMFLELLEFRCCERSPRHRSFRGGTG
ncbi:putative 115 kDa protein in type-1 retrotransposable element R1DM [Formica fusca]